MCFTPTISLATALTEWILATILLLFFRKTVFRLYFAVLIYVLGFYQFTEFMLCTGSSALLWAKLGFVTYSFLPAVALHSILKIFKRKAPLFWIYLIPTLASILALSTSSFIISASCMSVFVQVKTMLHNPNLLSRGIYFIYALYYFGFILLTLLIVIKDYLHQKNKIKREIDIIEVIGAATMLGATFILIIVFPYLRFRFPSVLCFFAIFFAIATFAIAYLETKIKNSRKS